VPRELISAALTSKLSSPVAYQLTPLRARLGGARAHPHPFCNHENRVKAHAELADDLGKIDLFIPGCFHELARPRLSNRPQVLDDLVASHADAGILDGKQALFLLLYPLRYCVINIL
jgi:hypothetical protein